MFHVFVTRIILYVTLRNYCATVHRKFEFSCFQSVCRLTGIPCDHDEWQQLQSIYYLFLQSYYNTLQLFVDHIIIQRMNSTLQKHLSRWSLDHFSLAVQYKYDLMINMIGAFCFDRSTATPLPPLHRRVDTIPFVGPAEKVTKQRDYCNDHEITSCTVCQGYPPGSLQPTCSCGSGLRYVPPCVHQPHNITPTTLISHTSTHRDSATVSLSRPDTCTSRKDSKVLSKDMQKVHSYMGILAAMSPTPKEHSPPVPNVCVPTSSGNTMPNRPRGLSYNDMMAMKGKRVETNCPSFSPDDIDKKLAYLPHHLREQVKSIRSTDTSTSRSRQKKVPEVTENNVPTVSPVSKRDRDVTVVSSPTVCVESVNDAPPEYTPPTHTKRQARRLRRYTVHRVLTRIENHILALRVRSPGVG